MSLTIRLHSVKCIEEINEASASEEPYALVTSVSLQGRILPNLPPFPNFRVLRYGVWEDFDAGEVKVNSGPPFWGFESTPRDITNVDDVIFVVTLMENDNADPDSYRQLVLGAAGASLVSTLGTPSRAIRATRLLDDIRRQIDSVPSLPFALDDDHIGTVEFRLDTSDLIPFGIKDKVLTIKSDEGHYELTFRIRRLSLLPPGAPIAIAKQTGDILTATLVDRNGALNVAFVIGTGEWEPPLPISGFMFPTGAAVAMTKQTDDILSALLVDQEGFLNVAFVVGTGQWQGPVRISGSAFSPGASVAMAKQTNDILSALLVDREGFLNVAFVIGSGRWQGPIRISGPVFPPGVPVAMAKQTDDILSALLVDQEGFLNVAFVIGTEQWQGPVRISGPAFPPGAPIAMAKQTNGILTALLVDREGFLNVAFVIGSGRWQGPVRISDPVFQPLAHVAMAKQTNDILSALLVDREGFLNVAFVIGTGQWQGPVRIT